MTSRLYVRGGARPAVQSPPPIDHSRAAEAAQLEQDFGHTVFGTKIPKHFSTKKSAKKSADSSYGQAKYSAVAADYELAYI